MAFYLRRQIFEEFDPDSMICRLRSSSRVFCILGEEEYNYLASRGDVPLYLSESRARLLTRISLLILSGRRSNREAILASNYPAPVRSN
jgi:hypothetical protein